jgi:hypothetical protein
MEGGLIHIGDFHTVQRLHLQETNQIIARKLARGNITYALDGLAFTMPIREIAIEGKTELFVLLSGKMEPSDRFFRVRITPQLQVEEMPPMVGAVHISMPPQRAGDCTQTQR